MQSFSESRDTNHITAFSSIVDPVVVLIMIVFVVTMAGWDASIPYEKDTRRLSLIHVYGHLRSSISVASKRVATIAAISNYGSRIGLEGGTPAHPFVENAAVLPSHLTGWHISIHKSEDSQLF